MQGSALNKTMPLALKPYGERAIVIESTTHSEQILVSQKSLRALETVLRCTMLEAIEDIVLGNGNLTVIYNPRYTQSDRIERWILQEWIQLNDSPLLSQSLTQARHLLTASFTSDVGIDLKSLAIQKNCSVDAIINEFCSQEYTVLFLGFLPGFSYLHGLPKRLHAERRAIPRDSIAEGSIAIGGSQAGIYPIESPGGWQIIGRLNESHLPLFNPDLAKPNMFSPGDILQFRSE